jgi:hypothetical protein
VTQSLAAGSGGEPFDTAFGRALLLLESGDFDAVEALATSLRARHGTLPQLDWLVARAQLSRGRFEQAAIASEHLLANAPLAPAQQADVLLLRGEALDGLGRHREAFAAAADGKAIIRRLFADRAASRESQLARLDRLRRWFSAADPGAWRRAPAEAPVPHEPRAHAFILGFPRSGTTLLEQALAGHPDVAALEEAPTLAEPYAEYLASDPGCARLARLGADEAQALRARYWAQVRGHGVETAGRLFVDKAPAETLSLPLIARLFPRARILFAVRDPRDVVLSCLRNNFQLNALTYAFTDLAETSACYDACMRLYETYRAALPIEPLEVRHEALASDFPGQIAAVAGFLGLAPHAVMFDPAAVARRRRVLTPSAPQVRSGLNQAGLGRWRAYAAELEPVLPRLQPWVARWGYEPS